ncbi:MAG: hypothetical protein IKJ99_03055 [Oscillospiraceae bacterium]|nr:hypothetical protein [Oscillospiraceae bacterium]
MKSYPVSDYRYREQQQFLNELAVRHGFVTFRPDYHGLPRDCNTVLFYTMADAKHNREVDREPTSYSRSEANDRMKYGGIQISEKYIYRDHFFAFENTNRNGHYDLDFANFGRLDLRGSDWHEKLEGAILMAVARKKQQDHIRSTGGYGELREADDTYNDLNRELIRSFRIRFGKAYMGDVNFYDEDREKVVRGEKSVYEEYTGQMVYNFGCSFVVPTQDGELEKLIRDWNSDDRLPKDPDDVKKIMERVDKLGGIHLIWF